MNTETKMQWDQEDKKYKPAYISDCSRVDNAVQAAFSTIDVDDSSKLTGDLPKAPSLDIWENRSIALMARKFPALNEDQKVQQLQGTLSGDAQSCFPKECFPGQRVSRCRWPK